jgi:uncharacterized protein YutE (UPF0331/DUF86 family)
MGHADFWFLILTTMRTVTNKQILPMLMKHDMRKSRLQNQIRSMVAFGKSVVCSYLIAERKVNTLILLHNKDLLEQWVEELRKFLTLDEEPPTYKTKTGQIRRRESANG